MSRETKAVVLHQPHKPVFEAFQLPPLGAEDVLIKVHSSPINPSDTLFIAGLYPTGKPSPTVVGFEGSGVVLEAGSNESAQALLGREVVFLATGRESIGAWAEQTVVHSSTVFPVPGELDLEEAACSIINPVSVQCMIHECRKENHKVIVHSAAASAFGKMLVAACQKEGIELVAIVRRGEQVESLRQLGVAHVLSSVAPDFPARLKETLELLKPTAFFDAVGGKDGSLVFSRMPPASSTFCYGALSLENYSVGPGDLIFKNKALRGFWLSTTLADPTVAKQIFADTFSNLASKQYKSDIANRFCVEKFQEALEYYKAHMSAGKTLLQNPHFNS